MAYPYMNMGVQPFQMQPQVQSQFNNNSGITWVQGESGAKSFLVAPNNTVTLWDSESQTIYLKSADASGMPSMRIIDYTFRDTQSRPNEPLNKKDSEYATKEDLEALRGEFRSLREQFNKVPKQIHEQRPKKENKLC